MKREVEGRAIKDKERGGKEKVIENEEREMDRKERWRTKNGVESRGQ